MRFCLCASSIVLTLVGQTPLQPDFTGRWVLIVSPGVPPDGPAVLSVKQHSKRTDMQGRPMVPYWESVTVEHNDLRSGVRSGSYRIGIEGGISSTGNRTFQSATWDGDTLVITNEKWVEPRIGERESFVQHREVWALEQGRLVITVDDTNGEVRTRTLLTYRKEELRR